MFRKLFQFLDLVTDPNTCDHSAMGCNVAKPATYKGKPVMVMKLDCQYCPHYEYWVV